MLTDFYATKKGMTQAWTSDGKRLAVTRLQADDVVVARVLNDSQLELGIGQKRAKNVAKPVRVSLEKNNVKVLPATIVGARWVPSDEETIPQSGTVITCAEVLHVGDVVSVSGTTKGRGFAGAVKRYGFKGGPKTHGQSDRTRAVGSISAGTTPGRVFKGKRMPGHYGVETKTITGLQIVHINAADKEIWINGPVPGHINSVLKITTTGVQQPVKLDLAASSIQVVAQEAEVATTPSPDAEVQAPASSDTTA